MRETLPEWLNDVRTADPGGFNRTFGAHSHNAIAGHGTGIMLDNTIRAVRLVTFWTTPVRRSGWV